MLPWHPWGAFRCQRARPTGRTHSAPCTGAPGAFVMPNPWDVGTARILAGLGFEALATTSAGFAFTLGRRDAEGAITRDEALAHARTIVDATPLPVSADLENGFGDAPEAVAETIRRAAAAGLVGGSIEDATGDPQPPDLRARAGGRAHRRRGRGGARARLAVHAHRARRELPLRPPRPRRHDRAPAGVRGGGRGRALRPGPARPRRDPDRLHGGRRGRST